MTESMKLAYEVLKTISIARNNCAANYAAFKEPVDAACAAALALAVGDAVRRLSEMISTRDIAELIEKLEIVAPIPAMHSLVEDCIKRQAGIPSN